MEYTVKPLSGISIDVKEGEYITVVDAEGGQVADFFAEIRNSSDEFLSTGVTVDCNESLYLNIGDTVYSNKYRPMFTVIQDDVGNHDLIHPCCRPEMFEFFYHNGKNHKNCLDNINNAIGKNYPIIHPINLFMNTKIEANGKISVLPPISNVGDRVILHALTDVRIGVSACSVSESSCNSGACTSIKIIISESINQKAVKK